jgi:sugar phosphate isomerase/epimerase
MGRDYRISLWNYTHYSNTGSLEQAVKECSDAGYGVELWDYWKDDRDLFGPVHRERLRVLLKPVQVSFHSGGVKDLVGHMKQIETAQACGCDVIVVHADNLRVGSEQDFDFAREVVALAGEHGVTLALENGPLWMIERALENVEGLSFCLDTGHTYHEEMRPGSSPGSMRPYLDAFKTRLVHLHLQDWIPEGDHYSVGTGIIPRADWEYLLGALDEIKFSGALVIEIRPRGPLLLARDSVQFLQGARAVP